MDPIAQLGRDAYYALCVAFAAQHKDKLYAPETDVLLDDARDLLGVTEEDDRAIRSQIDQDPMIAALRRGELPPGGIRPLLLPASRAGTPFGGMPPPTATTPAALGGGFDTPFSTQQQKAAAKKTSATPSSVAAAPVAAAAAAAGPPPPGATGTALVGRKLQRLFPDLSPPWVTGTVMQYNAATGKHLIAYTPPLRKELWECIADFAPQNFRWLEAGAEPAAPAASKGGGAGKTGGSKSSAKASTPKAPPPPPVPKAPPAPIPVPGVVLAGGPSTHHATGVSLTSAPFSEGFLRSCLAKNKPDDLATMLTATDDRGVTLVRELVAVLEDPGDIADINRLLDESQQLGQREQQLRAELRELGVMG